MPKLVCFIRPDSPMQWLPGWLAYHGAIFGHGSLLLFSTRDNPLPPALAIVCERLGVQIHHLPENTLPEAIKAAQALLTDENPVIICPPGTLVACIDPHQGISLSADAILAAARAGAKRNLLSLNALSPKFDTFSLNDDNSITLVSRQPVTETATGLIAIRLPPLPKIANAERSRGKTEPPLICSDRLQQSLTQMIPQNLLPPGFEKQRAQFIERTIPARRNRFDYIDIDEFDASALLEAHPTLTQSLSEALAQYCRNFYRGGQIALPGEAGIIEVFSRMAGFRADNPKRPVGIIPLVPLVSHSSLRDKIWDILDQAITTYPKNFGIVNAARRAAHENKDFARAANLAMHAISIAPEQPIAYHHAIMAMIHNGQTDEGETLATAALEKFPDVIGVLRAAADLAKIRGDVTAISARWNKLLTLLPNDLKIQTEGAALRFAGLLQPAQDDDDDQPLGPVAVGMTEAERAEALRALGVADETAMRDLMLRFESLGRSCEFGLLQRRFGAEPLGLLRWNGIAPPSLVRALEQKFSGFNDEDNVYVTSKSGRMLNEYTVRDRAYGTAMHSHVYKEHVSEEKVLPQQRRRVLFLLRKLTEELEQGDKICVVLGPPPAPQYLNRLVRAIRGFGQCPILVVSAQTEPGQAGAVQDLGNGVLRGYLRYEGRDAPSSNGRREWNIDYDSWMKIIKTVSDLILVRSEIPATAP